MRWLLLYLALIGGCTKDVVGADTPIQRARAAFMQNDFAAATKAYQEVLQTDTVTAHRIEAATSLATYAWRLHRDTTTALTLLAVIERALPEKTYAPRMLRARILREQMLYARAASEAIAALEAATTPAERMQAEIAHAAAIIAHRPSITAIDSTITMLRRIVRENPGRLEPARLLVHAAALRADQTALREGWSSYYLVLTGDTSSGPLALSRRVMTQQSATREQLARALADSKFFDAAVYLIPTPTTDAQLNEIRAYAAFTSAVQRVTDEYYRQIALGSGSSSHDQWRTALDSLARALWPQLHWQGAVPDYDHFEKTGQELERRFGAVATLGETAGQRDMHYGHTVVDTRRLVRQYGHEADVRFIALDAIVSNGYQSWAWDGAAAHGGWGGADRIVQIRPGYADAPLAVWASLHDTIATGERRTRLRADSVADFEKAKRDSVAYFPSVAARIRRDGREALLDSLKTAGLSGRELEKAFVRAFGGALQESSIFAHEGRHAIDQQVDKSLSAAEREYRAKLSEIAFAPRPRMALDGILSPNLGDGTPHGQANARVLTGLHRWMRQHQDEITGLQPSAPLLPQLPLLTDEQLRRAAASLDPLAKGEAEGTAAPHSPPGTSSLPPKGRPGMARGRAATRACRGGGVRPRRQTWAKKRAPYQ